MGLFGDAAVNHLASGRVEPNLTGKEEEIARADGLAVWANGPGSFGRGDRSEGRHGPQATLETLLDRMQRVHTRRRL